MGALCRETSVYWWNWTLSWNHATSLLRLELEPHACLLLVVLKPNFKFASANLLYIRSDSIDTLLFLLALPTTQGKDIVFGFIIEYSSLKDFGP